MTVYTVTAIGTVEGKLGLDGDEFHSDSLDNLEVDDLQDSVEIELSAAVTFTVEAGSEHEARTKAEEGLSSLRFEGPTEIAWDASGLFVFEVRAVEEAA